MQVRAKVNHTQPGTHAYRVQGEVFSHDGKLYEHVERADEKKAEAEEKVPASDAA